MSALKAALVPLHVPWYPMASIVAVFFLIFDVDFLQLFSQPIFGVRYALESIVREILYDFEEAVRVAACRACQSLIRATENSSTKRGTLPVRNRAMARLTRRWLTPPATPRLCQEGAFRMAGFR